MRKRGGRPEDRAAEFAAALDWGPASRMTGLTKKSYSCIMKIGGEGFPGTRYGYSAEMSRRPGELFSVFTGCLMSHAPGGPLF
jgi:hypothetical protein